MVVSRPKKWLRGQAGMRSYDGREQPGHGEQLVGRIGLDQTEKRRVEAVPRLNLDRSVRLITLRPHLARVLAEKEDALVDQLDHDQTEDLQRQQTSQCSTRTSPR